MTKKEIIKSISFIAIFLWLLVSVTYVVRMNGDVKDRFAGFYSEPKNSIDAIIIGSSPVYPCYATPKIWGDTGIATYLLSSNMQRPVAGYYLVKEARKTQKPKLFIFEMRMYAASEEDMMSNMAHTREVTDNRRYSWNRIQTINAMVPNLSERYTYYFDIFKYHSNWKTMVLWSQLRDCTYSYPDDLKGYVTETKVGPAKGYDASADHNQKPIEDIQEKYLRKLLEELRAEGQDALFIVTPYLLTADKQENYNYMQEIIESYGYRFLNMNDNYEDIGIDFATDFMDYGNHVNAQGGAKVTDYLEKYLQENYDFKDKRGNSAYRSWDDAYTLYSSQYQDAEKAIAKRIADKDWTVLEEEN